MSRSLMCMATAFAIATASAAYADCASDLAELEGTMPPPSAEGISKDGSLAPLQGDSAAAAPDAPSSTETAPADDMTKNDGNNVAKNGSTAPLQPAGDSQTQQAMSGQDAQAQQTGEPTAAAKADGASAGSDERSMAIAKARKALDEGDEAACSDAVERAKAL